MKRRLSVLSKSIVTLLISVAVGMVLSLEELLGFHLNPFDLSMADYMIALFQFLLFTLLSWLLLNVNVVWARRAGNIRQFLYSLLITVVLNLLSWFGMGPVIQRSNEGYLQFYESIRWDHDYIEKVHEKNKGAEKHDKEHRRHPFYFHDSIEDWMVKSFLLFVVLYVFTRLYNLSVRKEEVERSYEKLKNESLQSQISALNNQINPHFFFNALNSLHSLILEGEKEKSLSYLSNLSNVFRYILQSEKKGLVSLADELSFLQTYQFMLSVKYEQKLRFDIRIDTMYSAYKLPALSLLPIIENVIKHNEISAKHPMTISMFMNATSALVIQNEKREKLDSVDSAGIGLKNLNNRFKLLSQKEIGIEETSLQFSVCLPLLNN